MAVTSRQEFIDYTLRHLGYPVVQINVDSQQIEDRLDEALEYMYERHFDFNERAIFAYPITETDRARHYFDTTTFGYAIGAQLKTFADGSTGYWPAAQDIRSISHVYAPSHKVGDYMFDLRYQMTLFDFFGLYFNQSGYPMGPMASYMEAMSYVNLINNVFNYPVSFTYTKTTDRLSLDTDYSKLTVSTWLLIEAYVKVDPEKYTKIWNDRVFKLYFSAVLKKQWAQNLMKFSGVPLPGGAQLNAGAMMAEATKELAEIDARLLKTHELPIDPFIG
jgi:hypothetical protein